jgi:hypothetical protein
VLDSGTTDGALHRVPAGTLTGTVTTDADGFPVVDTPGNVVDIVDFGDVKQLRAADGSFDPSFAPASSGFSFSTIEYLTFPRENFAFTDILGRNHTCADYGLACSGSPLLNFLGHGDLVPGVDNYAAILQGFGEYVEVAPGEFEKPTQPYGVECEACYGQPYVPIAEFYVDNGDGTATRQMTAGSYGALGSAAQYTASFAADPDEFAQEVFTADLSEPPTGGPPPRGAFGASARSEFSNLAVIPGGGANGGDVIEFDMNIENTAAAGSDVYLTSFNYQTKRRGLADINDQLDGQSQQREDLRLDSSLPTCTSLADSKCWNPTLGIGQFPNVIGNGLLFGQMVWPSATDRSGAEIDPDQVHVAPNGIAPPAFKLESVKKNGPFTPILKGNENFICIKSGLFTTDPDADSSCAGEPAILDDPELGPVAGNFAQRLGLAPGEDQTVRMRMDFGDFRGVILEILGGTLVDLGDPAFGMTRNFDCSDQRELEYCHPDLVGSPIGYLPGSTAVWQTPTSLDDVVYVIPNQPGDAPTVMNFADNFGYILAMAGFRPSAEFYMPDDDGTLIREQVLGNYLLEPETDPTAAPAITSTPPATGSWAESYTYQVTANGNPTPTFSVEGPPGMTISPTGLVEWTPIDAGTFPVTVRASNGVGSDAVQTFSVVVESDVIDDFNRRDGVLGRHWFTLLPSVASYRIEQHQVRPVAGSHALWVGGPPLGASQKASLVMTDVHDGRHGSQAMLLKVQGPKWLPLYLFGGIKVSYESNQKVVRVITHQPWRGERVIGRFPAQFTDGDRFSATALADGTVHVYRNGQLIGSADTRPSHGSWFASRGGWVGVAYDPGVKAKFDDFAGGSIG